MSEAKPDLPYGYLGPQGNWQAWGMSTVSHSNPEIHTDTNNLNIQIGIGDPMKITANLISVSTNQEYKENVLTQTEGKVVTLVLAMPSAGYFKLQIYGLLSSDQGKTLPNVYNYLIHNGCHPRDPVAPFPKQFAQWKDSCYLTEPFHLDNKDDAVFKVKVPGAKAVALTVDTEWFHLQKADEDNVWQGEVKGLQVLRGRTKKASLNANYGPDDNKYTSLLEYNL